MDRPGRGTHPGDPRRRGAPAADRVPAPARARAGCGLERVGETHGNHRVVLELVKAVVEPGFLGLRVALHLIAGGASLRRRGAAGRVYLRARATLEHDARVDYERQAAVDGASVADAEVGRCLSEIHRGVERSDLRSIVLRAVDSEEATRRLSLERELVPVEHRARADAEIVRKRKP